MNVQIQHDFSALPWHDAGLRGFSYQTRGSAVEFTLDVDFAPDEPTQVTLHGCRAASIECDFLGMELCGYAISSGTALPVTDPRAGNLWQRTQDKFDLRPPEPGDGDDLLLFSIELIHPGGSVEVLAQSFSIERR